MKVKLPKSPLLANDPDFGPRGPMLTPIDEPTGDTLDKLRQVVAKFAADMHADIHAGTKTLELADLTMVDKATGILLQIQDSERKAAKDSGVTQYTIEQILEMIADRLTPDELAILKAKLDEHEHMDTESNLSPVSYAPSKEEIP